MPISLSAQSDLEYANRAYEQAEELFGLFLQDYQKSDYEKSLEKYQQTIDRFQRQRVVNSTYADCFHKKGILYHIVNRPEKALEEYRKAVQAKKLVDKPVDTLFFKELILIGNIHFQTGNLDSVKLYYDDAENILHRFSNLYERKRLYNSLGAYYDALGNHQQAVIHYQKALSSLFRKEADYEHDKSVFQSNIAQAYLKLGKYSEALSLLKLAKEKNLTSLLSLNTGFAYLNLQQYDSALYNLQRASRSDDIETHIVAYNNLGSTFLEINQLDSAEWYFRESQVFNQQQAKSKNTHLVASYLGLAQTKSAQDSVQQALRYYQQALINVTFNFSDTTITKNPSLDQTAISLLYRFQALQGKAAAWNQYYRQDQDTTKLVHALDTYQLAIRVAQHIQKTYDNDEAKLFLVNKVAPVYEEAIATAVQLYELTQDPRYVTQAFQFSENSKASVLTESLRDVKIKASGAVNDSLLQEEQRVKQQITALRLKLVESQDSAKNERYRQQLNDLEIALARTIKYLQKDEHYYQRKYQPDTLDIAVLQRSLVSSDKALLEYFVGKDQLYLFLMTSDQLQVTSVARTAELDSALQRTQRQLYSYKPGQGNDEASLATLYRYLIAPVAETVAEVSKLTIIADGPLHYLPFDLLSVDGRPANYLLQTHTLHYGYSALLLQQAADERRGFPTATVLAMAPFAGEETGNVRSGGFGLLHYSQAEVESVGGSVYLEGKATKRQFLKVAGANNVLHLATHATVDSEDPSQSFIAFYPNQRDSVANYRLYTHELYNMRLDSVKLVVLSACEAGKGQLVRGEGVMSLARAFAYAGCPNIVTTLWKTDDWAAARLTSSMHQYLKEGWAKDEALRQAKLDYLADERVQPTQKAPYYWANFVFIGDPVPIYDDYRLWWWIGIGLLLLTIVGLLVIRRQWKAKEMA